MSRKFAPYKVQLKAFHDLQEKIQSMGNQTNIYWIAIIFKTVLHTYYTFSNLNLIL